MTNIYSKRFETEIKDMLLFAEKHGRIRVIEWRNFIDYDLIPIFRKIIEETKKDLMEK